MLASYHAKIINVDSLMFFRKIRNKLTDATDQASELEIPKFSPTHETYSTDNFALRLTTNLLRQREVDSEVDQDVFDI